MHSECLRIADQLVRAFTGDAWHGPPLRTLLTGVTAEQATKRPVKSWHTIWELVLHIDIYVRIATDAAAHGTPMPKLYKTEKDWLTATDASEAAWAEAVQQMITNAERLAEKIAGFGDVRLKEVVPGREYDFYYLFHGVVQHSLYHGGQIAMLKRAVSES